MIASAASFPPPSLDQLHAAFLALVPRIETHAAIVFRVVRCPDTNARPQPETLRAAWEGDPPPARAGPRRRGVRLGPRLLGRARRQERPSLGGPGEGQGRALVGRPAPARLRRRTPAGLDAHRHD